MDWILSLHTPLVWTELVVIGCCSSKNEYSQLSELKHQRNLKWWGFGSILTSFSYLSYQQKTIWKDRAACAGHEAICITKELIVFKDLPEQRKLKEPKNQLTESCKFVKILNACKKSRQRCEVNPRMRREDLLWIVWHVWQNLMNRWIFQTQFYSRGLGRPWMFQSPL